MSATYLTLSKLDRRASRLAGRNPTPRLKALATMVALDEEILSVVGDRILALTECAANTRAEFDAARAS